jgi:hypothetical protein
MRIQDSTMSALAASVQGEPNHLCNYTQPSICTYKKTKFPLNLRSVAFGFISMLKFEYSFAHVVLPMWE